MLEVTDVVVEKLWTAVVHTVSVFLYSIYFANSFSTKNIFFHPMSQLTWFSPFALSISQICRDAPSLKGLVH
jgi:hypothetical protein